MISDAELVARVVGADDPAAFQVLVERHQAAIRGFLRRLLAGDHGTADDLAQETFITAYRKLGDLKAGAGLASWLHSIAYRQFRKDRVAMAGVGLVLLIGVVVNNGIVLVDYVNRRRREGMALSEAVHSAGMARLRPVLLTAITTILGLMPMVVGISLDFRNLAISWASEPVCSSTASPARASRAASSPTPTRGGSARWRSAISSSPSVTTLMILPLRARTSCTLPRIFS